MRIRTFTLYFYCMLSFAIYSQELKNPSLNLGDTAPPLYLKEWIRGDPIQKFEKGQVYVLEFWATWCKPCIAAMPYLSHLAARYKGQVTVVAVNVYEDENTSLGQIREFVDDKGEVMSFNIAVDDHNYMTKEWIVAAAEQNYGIPRSFVINAEGRLAWIGHPKDLDTVLQEIVDNSWDIEKARSYRNEGRIIDSLAKDVSYMLSDVEYDSATQTHFPVYATAESKLDAVEEIVGREPRLKNTHVITYVTFSSLLQVDQRKACEYAKEMLASSTLGKHQPYEAIIEIVTSHADTLDMYPEVYHTGAEAYKVAISHLAYLELTDIVMCYGKMAEWYWRGKDKTNAIISLENGLKQLKNNKNFSALDLEPLESLLVKYKSSAIDES
ncbi:TlpA family protein disulfide reductase [Sphingobacterium deserti]|uniref:Redoxin n=1 Tax=Sphingobacterium deserti TaxID=1229276 RepID=A0A0B8T309_9SPHI|nr:TlpA disulfide reductase family protein [Sphingobacterium deserti]KGE13338.1 redoxin [Sphingobacterium deserti]